MEFQLQPPHQCSIVNHSINKKRKLTESLSTEQCEQQKKRHKASLESFGVWLYTAAESDLGD